MSKVFKRVLQCQNMKKRMKKRRMMKEMLHTKEKRKGCFYNGDVTGKEQGYAAECER